MRIKRTNPTLEELTQKERSALEFVEHYIAQRRNRTAPTLQEIADHIGLSLSATYDLVNRLVEWGYLGRRSYGRWHPKRNLTVKRPIPSKE